MSKKVKVASKKEDTFSSEYTSIQGDHKLVTISQVTENNKEGFHSQLKIPYSLLNKFIKKVQKK